jgi:hypothetical protein
MFKKGLRLKNLLIGSSKILFPPPLKHHQRPDIGMHITGVITE